MPKHLLEVLQCSDNDKITINADGNRLIIEKASKPSIEDLFADYDGEYEPDEIDWGNARRRRNMVGQSDIINVSFNPQKGHKQAG